MTTDLIPPAPAPPKRHTWVLVTCILFAVVGALVTGGLTLVGLSTLGDAARTTAATPAPSFSPDPADGGVAADAPTPEPAPAPAADTTGKVGVDTFTYADGVKVAVLKATRFTPSDFAIGAKPGDVGVLVTVYVENATPAAFDLTLTQVSLKAGDAQLEAARLYDSDHTGSELEGSVAPGRHATGHYAFAVPRGALGDLAISVEPDFSHNETIFTGAVK